MYTNNNETQMSSIEFDFVKGHIAATIDVDSCID